jgi:hypothetical protein
MPKSRGGLMCAITAVSDWIKSAPPLQAPLYNHLLAPPVKCEILSLRCLCLQAICADQLELVSRLLSENPFYVRKTVVRSRIYPHWDAPHVDVPFEHAYVNVLALVGTHDLSG